MDIMEKLANDLAAIGTFNPADTPTAFIGLRQIALIQQVIEQLKDSEQDPEVMDLLMEMRSDCLAYRCFVAKLTLETLLSPSEEVRDKIFEYGHSLAVGMRALYGLKDPADLPSIEAAMA